MIYNFTEAVIDVTLLRPCKDFGFVFGFEIRPTDGTPYHSGYIEANDRDSASQIILGAYRNNNLAKYQTNTYEF